MMSITVPDPDRQAELFGEREIEFISSQSPNKNVDPTSKAGKEQYLAIVDHIAGVFIADLARNYGITEAKVAGKFGHGGIMVGADAVKAGMAHRVATFEATHQALADERPRTVFDRPRRMASTSARLTELLQSVHLEQAIRPAAALRIRELSEANVATLTAGVDVQADRIGVLVADTAGNVRQVLDVPRNRQHTPDDGVAVADSPAPKADHMEDRRMPELPAAAPVSGAPDELSAFKARFESITNLCAVAGVPERAAEYIRSTKTEGEISAELLAYKRTQAAPAVPVTIPGEIRGTVDRAADRVFTSLGEELHAIVRAGSPGGAIDPRLLRLNAAATGAGTTVGTDGGFLVQKDFTTDLMKEAFGSGQLAALCSKTEISGNADGLEVAYVDETSRATGSRWGGVQVYRVDEGGTATQKKPKIGKWECRLEDLMGIAYVTERLMQDASAMASVFTEAFTDELGFVVDDEIYRGTGVGQCMGLLNAACTVSVAKESGQAADTIVAANLTKMWARILPRAKRRGVWFINTECTPQLDALSVAVGTGGELVYMPAGGLSDSPFGRLKGRPVIEIEQAAALGDTGDILFADLNYYKLITKGGIQEAESIHVQFLYNERVLRWVTRVNGAPKLKSAITPYKGASGATLSPFVKLDAR
jgi:HK97 family phage major capsid protein